MPREKFKTLTEQMFYILLNLKSESSGVDIMERVSTITDGRVNIGPGTIYNLLEQFAEVGMIRETKVIGRQRSYILTDKGHEVISREYMRLSAMLTDYRNIFGEEEIQ